MTHYGDYCPIAVGVEVLGDRWTPLVIRELMVGASGFNEIQPGHLLAATVAASRPPRRSRCNTFSSLSAYRCEWGL